MSSTPAADRRSVPADRPTLIVIPALLEAEPELDALVRCLVSVWKTTDAADAIAMVVEAEGSDPGLVAQAEIALGELGYLLIRAEADGGHPAHPANAGLAHARDSGADAVVVDPRLELSEPGWLEAMRRRTDARGRLAAVVGGRLLDRRGLIRHAGSAFSLLSRDFLPRYRFAPSALPEALVPTRCPVGAALMFIRLETLLAVGLYDAGFDGVYEDVDYCLRTFGQDLDCVYEPAVVGVLHEEPLDQGAVAALTAREQRSLAWMHEKWSGTDLREWIPEVL